LENKSGVVSLSSCLNGYDCLHQNRRQSLQQGAFKRFLREALTFFQEGLNAETNL